MSKPEHDPLELAIENLSSPWDLVCVSLGIAVAGAAAVWGGWSTEALLPVGAFGALALRKGGQAMMARPRLRRRASAIEDLVGKTSQAQRDHLRPILAVERDLWERRASSHDEFSAQLDTLMDALRDDLSDTARQAVLEETKRLHTEIDALRRDAERLRGEAQTMQGGGIKEAIRVHGPLVVKTDPAP